MEKMLVGFLVFAAVVVLLITLSANGAVKIMSPKFLAGAGLLAGLIGIVISLLCVMGNGNLMVMVGLLISGSILFGCGMIALAIIHKSS